MEAIDGCVIGDGEREILLDYLAERYPRRLGAPSRSLPEYLFGALFVVLALMVAVLYRG